jgi:hypothetical protein
MPDFNATHYMTFSSSTGNPSGVTGNADVTTFGLTVTDANNDGNIDSTDYLMSSEFTYSGYTATIGGLDYAIFRGGATTFYIPYNSSVATPSNDSSTWTFNQVAEDAVVVNCFLSGTMIATDTGEVAVESLKIGDEILSADGKALKIKWVARQDVLTTFGPAERLMPVRFAAGALGDGLPHADLTVTADHGMLIDGIICHAGALVNGTTITNVPLSEFQGRYTVYHIETEEHEIILANGAPAETFIDNVSRRSFDNFAEFEALYGGVPEMEELDYPRAMSARQVPPRIKAKLGTSDAA